MRTFAPTATNSGLCVSVANVLGSSAELSMNFCTKFEQLNSLPHTERQATARWAPYHNQNSI